MPITATPGTGLDSTEYSGVPMNVVFNAGDTSKSFTVTAVQDTDDEPDRLLTFSFGTPLPEGYVPGTNSQLVLTLVDDDVPIVSATFDAATAEVQEGTSRQVTVSLSQAPEREVTVPIRATRGAGLGSSEYEGVPADVTIAADATEAVFTVTFADDTVEEGNETLTLTFGTYPDRVQAGTNTRLTLTVTDDDGPPLAPDVTVQTGDGYAELSWAPVANDSPVLRYEVRWRESDGGTFNAWQRVGLVTSYRVEGLDERQGVRVRGARGERARQRRGGLGAGDADRAADGDPEGAAVAAVRGRDRQQPGGAEVGEPLERHRPGHREQRECDVLADPGLPDRGVPDDMRRRGELVRGGAEHPRLRAQIRAPGAGAGRDPGEPLPGAGDQHQRQDGPVVERGDARPDAAGALLAGVAELVDGGRAPGGLEPGRQPALRALHGRGRGALRAAAADEEGLPRDRAARRGVDALPGGGRLRRHVRLAAPAVGDGVVAAGGSRPVHEPLCEGPAGGGGLAGRAVARGPGQRSCTCAWARRASTACGSSPAAASTA